MRVAVCISGLIGYTKHRGSGKVIDFYKTKEYFDKNLFHNVHADYFLHCWDEKFKNELIDLYKPKDYVFENFLENNKNLPPKDFGIFSNHFSKKKVVEIKKTYEENNNFIYDLVILTRFDILIYPKLNLNSLNKEKFYVTGPKTHHKNNCKCLFCDVNNVNHCLNDPIFIGSSSDINSFSNAFDYLDEYGYSSNHIVTKKHILKTNLWEKIDYVFNWPTNKYPQIWLLLEIMGLFPKGMVPARIFEVDIPLIRWVDKSFYLKTLDLVIFKLKIDIIYYYLIYKPLTKIKFILKFKNE